MLSTVALINNMAADNQSCSAVMDALSNKHVHLADIDDKLVTTYYEKILEKRAANVRFADETGRIVSMLTHADLQLIIDEVNGNVSPNRNTYLWSSVQLVCYSVSQCRFMIQMCFSIILMQTMNKIDWIWSPFQIYFKTGILMT